MLELILKGYVFSKYPLEDHSLEKEEESDIVFFKRKKSRGFICCTFPLMLIRDFL